MATQGKLNVTIGADTTPMTAGLNKAMAGLRSFLTLGALAGAARQAIAYGSAINDMAAKTQVGVKWLQATAYAAKLAGSSMDELSNALVELRRAQAQALGGSASDVGAFAKLGISIQQLRSLGPEELFDRVAEAVRRTNGGIDETNAALQVLGRGGKGLLAGMVQGFSEARAEAARLGLILDEETITAMDELGDRLDTLNLGFTALSATILKNMMSLNNWAHFAKLVGAMIDVVNPGRMVRAFASNGIQGVLADRAALMAQMEGILESYQQGEEGTGSKRKKEEGSSLDLGKGKVSRTAANELARIGGYVGGGAMAGNPLLRVQNQALVELRQIRGALARMAARQPGETVTW